MKSLNDQEKDNWKKNITLFLGSQTISLFGSSLVQYAIMWYITLNTQSGVMMTISIVCGFVPTFILSPIAGVWADRYNRKILIILSDSLIAISTLVFHLVLIADELWLLSSCPLSVRSELGSDSGSRGHSPATCSEDKKVSGQMEAFALVMLVSHGERRCLR
jgi:DHA3 family macrolide efflux protein-like MFS transporter